MIFKKFHKSDWNYESNGINYIKVGVYGTDDLEYRVQANGSVYLPELEVYYSSLEKAYTKENQSWFAWHKKK